MQHPAIEEKTRNGILSTLRILAQSQPVDYFPVRQAFADELLVLSEVLPPSVLFEFRRLADFFALNFHHQIAKATADN
jgi:hypothetical protein